MARSALHRGGGTDSIANTEVNATLLEPGAGSLSTRVAAIQLRALTLFEVGTFMIKKLSEEWGRVEEAVGMGANMGDHEARELLKGIAGVRDTLRRMCEVSVTRTTLHAAVRDALLPILREHGRDLIAELYPEFLRELDDLKARVAALSSGGAAPARAVPEGLPLEAVGGMSPEVSNRLADLEERLRELASVQARIRRIDERAALVDERLGLADDRIATADERLGSTGERIDQVGEQVGRIDVRVNGIEARVEQNDASLEALREDLRRDAEALRGRLDATEERHGQDLGALRETIEEQLRGGLLVVEERLEKARTHFLELLSKLEASVPGVVSERAGELEARLRKEIEGMIRTLEDKLSDLRGMLSRLEALLPRREVVESMDSRLGRLEEGVSRVSAQVESIDSLAPEIRAIEGRFESLADQIANVLSGVGDAGRGLQGLRDTLDTSQGELRSLLNAGIRRWEEDQSQVLERLAAIRDTLRDQLRSIGDQAAGQGKGIWGKLTGRGEGGLRLTREEWDQLAGKIEGIVSGLDAILVRKRPG